MIGDANFFLRISSSWVIIRLHNEDQLHRLSGSLCGSCDGVGGVVIVGWAGLQKSSTFLGG